jgi:pimeloyl-ACP methyl ester carboxylesterase
VAPLLRDHGHTVVTPTQTGLGERAHLLSRSITLDTFVEDIVNVLKWEDLHEVVLVGHSFGGNAISGVADHTPERIKRLVYLDSVLLTDGQSPFSVSPPDLVAARVAAAEQSSDGLSLPPPPPDAFGVTDAEQAAWLAPRLTPHPLSAFQSPLKLANPVTNGLPATYIVCTDPLYGPLQSSRNRARELGLHVVELATGHDAMVTAPRELAGLLEADSA